MKRNWSIHGGELELPDVQALLSEHLDDMQRTSPPDSVHTLDHSELARPEIRFLTVRDGERLAACGALQVLDSHHGEIKSMRTTEAYRGRGVARFLLKHLIDEARSCGLTRLSLETGSHPAFEPARRLYASAGFEFCGPFAGYVEDDHSLFMTRKI